MKKHQPKSSTDAQLCVSTRENRELTTPSACGSHPFNTLKGNLFPNLTVLRSYGLTVFLLLLLLSGCKKTDTDEKNKETKLSPPEWIQGTWKNGETQNFTFTSEDVFVNGVSLKNQAGRGSGDAVLKETQKTNNLYELLLEYSGGETKTTLYSFKKGDGTFIEAGIAQNDAAVNYEKYNYSNAGPVFSSFSFTGQRKVVIDEKSRTVKSVAELSVDLKAIKPIFTLTPTGTTATVKGALQTSGSSKQDFTNPVKYLLKSNTGETAEWTVIISYPGGGGDDDEEEEESVKAATLIYYFPEGPTTIYFCFDNYGKIWRLEAIDPDCGNRGIIIGDKINGIAWVFGDSENDPCPSEWKITDYDLTLDAVSWPYLVDYFGGVGLKPIIENWKLAGFERTKETIAGQKCYVYTGPMNAVYGIWRKSVIMRLDGGVHEGYEAISAREGCPANAFTQTVEIGW